MYDISSQPWSAGSASISEAWNTYKEQIGTWIMMYVAIVGINTFCSLIPYVGTLLSSFSGIILGGIFVGVIHNYVAYQKVFSSELITEIVDEHINTFIKLGALSMGFWFLFNFGFLFAIGGFFISVVGFGFLEDVMNTSSPDEISRLFENLLLDETVAVMMLSTVFFAIAIGLIIAVLYFMAFVFTPYLIIVKKEDVIRALTMSFTASQQNLWSLTSISLWWILLSFIGVLTCCVGILATGPIITISTYYLACKIFTSSSTISIDKD